jgi:hypothetical protein
MTEAQSSAIAQFFAAVERLKSLKVIRSDKYLGDIAEFICKDQFGLELATSGRQPGYDGHIKNKRIQVKFAGGSSTTVDCGDPKKYDELFILLGPKSVLRSESKPKGFVAFRIPSATVSKQPPHADGKRRYTKGQLPTAYLVPSSK